MEVLSNSFWILSLIKEQDAPMSSVWEDVIKMFSCETSRLLHPTVSCLYWPRLWALKSRILRMRLKNNSFMEWVFLAEQLNPQITKCWLKITQLQLVEGRVNLEQKNLKHKNKQTPRKSQPDSNQRHLLRWEYQQLVHLLWKAFPIRIEAVVAAKDGVT